MAWYNPFSKANPRKRSGGRRKRKTDTTSSLVQLIETSKVVSLAIFLVTVASIVFISFVGISPAGFQILPNQLASVRIIADYPFSYQSKILTDRKKEQLSNQIPPVYTIEMGPYKEFAKNVEDLLKGIETLEPKLPSMTDTQQAEAVANLAASFNAKGPYRLASNDLSTIMEYGDPASRKHLIDNALFILKQTYQAGVYEPGTAVMGDNSDTFSLFNIKRSSGQIGQTHVQPMEDALTFLRISLTAENIPPAIATAAFRLFRNGLTPNLIFDQKDSARLKKQMLETLKPVVVHVEKGRSIIEPGTRVTPEQHEMLQAYQEFLNSHSELPAGMDVQLLSRVLLVIAMIIAAVFYIRLEDRLTLQSNGRLALLALVVVLNLSLVRGIYELGTTPIFLDGDSTAALIPYLAPTMLAPIILAVLIGAGPSIFAALLISIFTAVIFGNRLDLLVISFLSSTVAIYGCRAIRFRSKLVGAGGWAGSTVALFALLLGLADHIPLLTIGKQMIAGQTIGFVTGIVVVGLLPILESVFKRTTDITLIELTDYNHPLLRRMQMDAPGTYHHSLMVANLSENAANAIGANALLCRVCSMFHDIGKLVKPEYFSENQREGINPHDEKSPSFSALIIKSHVKEGVDMAIKHKLPKVVIDIIKQHHGTSLIWFFYQRAKELAKAAVKPHANGNGTDVAEPVSESIYRYDGPRPRFRESAIIFFADSVEAASRSLRKVTPQHIEELVSNIFSDKIADGQIDESPLTLEEIAKIKSSFIFTLLNSLHSRVSYPKGEKEAVSKTSRTAENKPEPAVGSH